MSRSRFCWALLVLVGCGPAVATEGSDGSTGVPAETSSGRPDTTSSTTSPTTTSPPVTSAAAVTTASDDSTSTTTQGDESSSSTSAISSGFITDPDGGAVDGWCSVWEDDTWCARGDECKPWANGGDPVWTATRCVSPPEDPDLIGESCVVEQGAFSGFDSCEARSMCFDVDPDTLVGTCVAYCIGDAEAHTCADPDTTCVVGNDEVIALCLPSCDPLLQNCANEEMCTGNFGDDTGFFCMPPGTPYFNDELVFPAACNAGQVGVLPGLVEGCLDDEPCCTAFCDLAELDTCAEGLECVPWVPEGNCPGVCDEGVCLSPS